MMWKIRQTGQAAWKYLNQPLFDPSTPTRWQISQFWYAYQIQSLEKCWLKESSSESHYTQ